MIINLNANSNEWVIGNLHHSGFYRVNYDKKNWELLIQQLNTDYTKIHEINRVTLIDDSFNLGRAEKISQKLFLDIVKYLENEKDPMPWKVAFNGLSFIGKIILMNKYLNLFLLLFFRQYDLNNKYGIFFFF